MTGKHKDLMALATYVVTVKGNVPPINVKVDFIRLAGKPFLSFSQLTRATYEGNMPSMKEVMKEVTTSDDCDDYIDDSSAPAALRKFLAFARSPAHGQLLSKPHPKLFADYEGQRVRVTMASRLGDVGITTNLDADFGYKWRVRVRSLSNFSETP